MVKLHLGCGIEGFVNVDASLSANSDVIDDPTWLSRFDEGSVELIYAPHILHKVERSRVSSVLRRWFKALEPGGTLRLSVPDLGSFSKLLVNDSVPLVDLLPHIYQGGSRTGFDFDTLSADLKNAGFRDVRTWDWRTTDHSHVSDRSQAALSWYGKQIPLSLNVEASKPLR